MYPPRVGTEIGTGAAVDDGKRRKTRSRLGFLFGLAALGALIGGVLHFGDAEHFVALARQARPGWLLVALGLQAATYATEAGSWGGVLSRAGVRRPLGELYALSLVALFTNQMVPTAGVAGTLLVVRAMEQRGIPSATAVSAVLVDLIGYYVAFGLAVASGVVILWEHHDLHPLVLAMAGAIVVVGVGISAGALWITAPGRSPPAWTRRWGPVQRAVDSLLSGDPALLRDPRLLARATALRAGNFAFDALTLWACLKALGVEVSVPPVVAAYVVGALARTLGIVPGGLGTFEGATIGGLALFGVDVEPALAGTLLFRGLSFWLPMLPGLWLGRRLSRAAPLP